ncbi:acyltransferase [Kocuria palustris]|uniref:acyltransferase family protein n=1 Tax=Kocuria palustris TaxID=71999 RepID=UPI0016430288|nr:acyltransferase [Kocuria palustris]
MPALAADRSSAQGGRFEWMDAVRGIAIVLVVLRHATTVPVEFGIDAPEWFRNVHEFLVPFRMPSLMLLSGMLLDRSLAKGLPRYARGKVRGLLWPYLIWAFIFLGLNDGGDSWLDPTAWIATSYLWFLFFLLIYYAVAIPLRPLPAGVVIPVMWGASLLLPDGSLPGQLTYFAGWFFLGQLLSRHPEVLRRLTRPVPAGFFAVIGLGFAAYGIDGPPELEYRAEFAVFALMGILALIAGIAALPQERLSAVRAIGRTSMIWYVAHVPILLVVRRVLATAGIESFWAHWAIGSAAALLGSWILVRLSRRGAPFSWLFRAPEPEAGGHHAHSEPRPGGRHPRRQSGD